MAEHTRANYTHNCAFIFFSRVSDFMKFMSSRVQTKTRGAQAGAVGFGAPRNNDTLVVCAQSADHGCNIAVVLWVSCGGGRGARSNYGFVPTSCSVFVPRCACGNCPFCSRGPSSYIYIYMYMEAGGSSSNSKSINSKGSSTDKQQVTRARCLN